MDNCSELLFVRLRHRTQLIFYYKNAVELPFKLFLPNAVVQVHVQDRLRANILLAFAGLQYLGSRVHQR